MVRFFHSVITAIGLLLCSLSIQAQTKPDFFIDRFDKANSQTLTKGSWYTFSDKTDNGASEIRQNYIKEGKNQFLTFNYKLQKGNWQWDPYATLACKITAKQVPPGIQAIAYEFKGSEHSFVYRSDNIKDYAYYQKLVPASKEWTTVTIPLAALSQPKWGAKNVFSETDLNALAWQVTGANNDSGVISIDNVRFLYTPQLVFTPDVTSNEINIAHTEFFHSQILNEDRSLSVYLPASPAEMKASNKKYPVIYLLDGDGHIKSLASMVAQLGPKHGNNIFPEMIIIGINNTDRWRDLSPSRLTKSPYGHNPNLMKTTGGNAQFISFIEKELIPHIDSIYPTTPFRTFIGHSLGGLTVVNTLLHNPQLFSAYLSVDPSLWWDNELMKRQGETLLDNPALANRHLFIATGNTAFAGVDTNWVKKDTTRYSIAMKGIFNFRDLLKKRPNNGLQWKNVYYPNDDHGSVPVIAHYDGLRYIFDVTRITFQEETSRANFNIDSAFTAHYKKVSEFYGYEVPVPEDIINNFGYTFLHKKNYKKAFECFAMNIRNYPNSRNTFDSMGEYYEVTGDKTKAIDSYTKSLANQENAYTRKKLEKLKAAQ